MRLTVGLLLMLTLAAPAGSILDGVCPACGYEFKDVFYGRGFYPHYLTLLYVSPELGEVLEVGFDYAVMLADHLGAPLPADFDEAKALVDAHYAEYEELTTGWTPPENLLDLLGEDGVLPAWVEVFPGLDYAFLPGEITLLDPYVGPHTCPVCGEETLEFHEVGSWD
jgi:hypothetical protein